MPQLWPQIEFNTENAVQVVLKLAREELHQLTERRVTMIINGRLINEEARVTASLMARGNSNAFPLLEISSNIMRQFPATIATVNPPMEFTANSEQELTDVIKRVLAYPETLEAVKQLYAVAAR